MDVRQAAEPVSCGRCGQQAQLAAAPHPISWSPP
jgi:hypothetical protein